MTMPSDKFFLSFCDDLQKRIAHKFRADWQTAQFQASISNIQRGHIVMVMDFAENYTCRLPAEIQSYHWAQQQATLHPMMLYYHDATEDVIKKEGLVIITADNKHDTYAVAKFEEKAIAHLQQKNIAVSHIDQWTDGCASQYKGKRSFGNISCFNDVHGISVTRNYFETSHGKSPCDGLGGIVKNMASRAVLRKRAVIRDARELFVFCEKYLTVVGQSSYQSRREEYADSMRSFIYIESSEINRQETNSDVKPLPGCRMLHSIRNTKSSRELKVRQLSCYCESCVRGHRDCRNEEHVQQWETRILSKLNTPSEDDQEAAQDQPTETGMLKTGDYVAVKLSSSGRLCRKFMYIAKVIWIQEGKDTHVQFMRRDRKYFIHNPDDISDIPRETS